MSFLYNLLNKFKVKFFFTCHIAFRAFGGSSICGPVMGIVFFFILTNVFGDGNVAHAGYFCYIDEYNKWLEQHPDPFPIIVADGEIPRPANSIQYSEIKRLIAEAEEDWEIAAELEPYRASYECLLTLLFVGFLFYYASGSESPYYAF